MVDARRFAGALVSLPLQLAGVGMMLLLTSCTRGAGDPPAAGGGGRAGGSAPVAVVTALVVEKPMAVNVQAVGNVEPSSTVEVRAQISGELTAVHFREGADVQAGDPLFTIDARAVEASLRQAEAILARDTAQSAAAEAQRGRLASLLKDGLIPQAEYEAQAASANALQAAIAASKAQIENATLLLQYTKVKAPVAGRTGALLVHQGTIIRANDASPLVVINRMAPVFVAFAVPARLLPRIRAEQTRGPLAVMATSARATGAPAAASTGAVSFIDNAVDPATDTIRLKATFPNASRQLWPGAFVDVTLRLSIEPRALVVPAAAVQPSQQGQFVFVVKSDQTVESRPVQVGWLDAGEAVIARGVIAGEQVVIDGQLRLTTGMRVTVKTATETKGAS